jgi:hypothetical protein
MVSSVTAQRFTLILFAVNAVTFATMYQTAIFIVTVKLGMGQTVSLACTLICHALQNMKAFAQSLVTSLLSVLQRPMSALLVITSVRQRQLVTLRL